MDEKHPFEVLSIAQGNYNTILLLDGGSYSDGARQWIINQSGKNCLLDVQNLGEFSRFTKAKL